MSARLRFAKAHGLGNDFILVGEERAPREEVAAWARRLCERHTGVGGDGVLLWSVDHPRRARMRLLNADGGEAEISGNGLRCLSASLVHAGLLEPLHVVTTAAGEREVEVRPQSPARFLVTCDLGAPILASDAIPMRLAPPRAAVIDAPLEAAGRGLRVTATSLGNPHCAVFVDEPVSDALLAELGAALERHPAFPRRTNVEFVSVVAPGELRVRFWERGVGPPRASGTGAASAAVAAVLGGRAERRVRVVCDGGVLEVFWPEGGAVRQTGEVELLFEGEWLAQAPGARP